MLRITIVASVSAVFLLAGPVIAEPVTVHFVHVNDLDRMGEDDGRGGVAKLAAVINSVREKDGVVIATHGGDAISPSLLSGFDQGAHMIDLLNLAGIDVMALGNHEFDFGPEVLEERVAEASFDMLSSNATMPDGSGIAGTSPHVTIEAGPYTISLFGLTAASTTEKSSPDPAVIGDPIEVAEKKAAELRAAGADMVVAVAHTDLGEDFALLEQGAVDLILSGDDHLVQINERGDSFLVESGGQAEYVTVVEVVFDTVEGRDGPEVTRQMSFDVINTAFVAPDSEVAARVQSYEDELSSELDIEIGTTQVEIDTRRSSVRTQETVFGNLLTDAMREATGADIALTNGGGIRADRIYEPGTVLTRRSILEELPFGNKTIVIELNGAQLMDALENAVSDIEEIGGRFAHVSGMAFAYDASQPAGSRITEATVGGTPVHEQVSYTLATNDFVGDGGDGYEVFRDAPRVIDANAGALMASQLIAHIERVGVIETDVEGRITAAN